MAPRKRGREEMESSEQPSQEQSSLTRLRNFWEFANLMQYIFIFGRVMKIDEDFDIDDLESECLRPEPSERLAEIGLSLLKFVSSHRGLDHQNFDEYTRRQYVAKAPSRNPFGVEETPNSFKDFDVYTKLRVLFQLSQWTFWNPDRLREKMPEKSDVEQTSWRIEELGYDKDERLYFVLDDNRLYRRTDPPIPPPPAPKPKANSKKGKALARANKRRKVAESEEPVVIQDETPEIEDATATAPKGDLTDTFGDRKWECVAVTLADYQDFLESIRKSRDEDEKALYKRLTAEVLPVIEKLAEEQQKKIARREKELFNLQKLATAKRSSRLASKHDKEKEEREAVETERKKKVDLAAAKKDLERQQQMDQARESRMMTREQRIKDREYKRLLHEEELANLSEDSRKLEKGEARMSERHLKLEMEKKKRELEELAQEDEWVFDCSVCGVHGDNLDDGSHSVACEKCNVWQHSACLGISQAAAEKDDFHLICSDCQHKQEDAKRPKIPTLKFKVGSSSSPPSDKTMNQGLANGESSGKRKTDSLGPSNGLPPMKKFKHVGIPHPTFQANSVHGSSSTIGGVAASDNQMHLMQQSLMNGPTLSPQGQVPRPIHMPPGSSPPPGLASPPQPAAAYLNGSPKPRSISNGYHTQYHHPATNGYRNTTGTLKAYENNSHPATYETTNGAREATAGNGAIRSPPRDPYAYSPTPVYQPTPKLAASTPSAFRPPSATPNYSSTIPTKQSSTFSSPSSHHGYPTPKGAMLPSSSPVIPQPKMNEHSGISPIKGASPPREAGYDNMALGMDIARKAFQPVEHLEPIPMPRNDMPPVKGVTPERA